MIDVQGEPCSCIMCAVQHVRSLIQLQLVPPTAAASLRAATLGWIEAFRADHLLLCSSSTALQLLAAISSQNCVLDMECHF